MNLEQHLAAHAAIAPDQDTHLVLCECGTWFDDPAAHRAHIADTWREARTVRSDTEVAQLGPGTILRDARGNSWRRGEGSWIWSSGGPALIMWSPDEDRAQLAGRKAAHSGYQLGHDGAYTCICGHPARTREEWDQHYAEVIG